MIRMVIHGVAVFLAPGPDNVRNLSGRPVPRKLYVYNEALLKHVMPRALPFPSNDNIVRAA